MMIEYQPKIRGWLLGSIDGQTQGMMPANYLKIMGKKQGEADLNKPEEWENISMMGSENFGFESAK